METLDAFLSEAALSPDAGSAKKGDLTIESILEEKRAFDLSLGFEKCGIEGDEGWGCLSRSCFRYTQGVKARYSSVFSRHL